MYVKEHYADEGTIRYFGLTNTVTKTVNSVLGYMPTVPHWGWNGNARRYWDNM